MWAVFLQRKIGRRQSCSASCSHRAETRTQLVPDVDLFPGHIACSSLSRSEIVVPMIAAGEVRGVLDIDSDQLATFDETDRKYLEKVVDLLVETLYQPA